MKNSNENLMWLAIGIAIILFIFGGFGGMMGYPFGMGSMMYNYNYSGMWLFGWLYGLLVLVALVLLIVWLLKKINER